MELTNKIHVQGLLIFYNNKKLDPVGQHFYYKFLRVYNKKLSKANYIDALKGIKKLSKANIIDIIKHTLYYIKNVEKKDILKI